MNSNQFLTLLQKGNHLQKEDFQQLVKLHASFPYFQIPAVLAAKYENENARDGSIELLHKAAILSPNRAWLRSLIEKDIQFLEEEDNTANSSVVIIDSQNDQTSADTINQDKVDNQKEEESEDSKIERENIQASTDEKNETENKSAVDNNALAGTDTEDGTRTHSDEVHLSSKETNHPDESNHQEETHDENIVKNASTLSELSEDKENKTDQPDLVTSSHPTEDTAQPLITSPSGEDENTKPDLILPHSLEEEQAKNKSTEEEGKPELIKPEEGVEDQPILEQVPKPPSSRQDILKQLEDNLAKLKLESNKNKPVEEAEEESKAAKPRRKRSGEDLIDSIKKKEKREIKDTKKKEQNDIIKAFNKKSIKMAAIKENEDVNKLQDLSLPSTKINDRMVSESYAKLLTQQGKKAAAKEIYKKLILKFPQKKAYFADLIQQLEE